MDIKCSDFFIFIWAFIMVIFSMGSRDDSGMDTYDRYSGLAGKGKTRGMFGTIYKDGEYDFWSNLMDHNPLYSY